MDVFVTGATGLIGRALTAALIGARHRVIALTRDAGRAKLPGARVVEGDPTRPGPWQEALGACDACVNLAGEPVVRRWTEERKRRIRESRVQATSNVAAQILADG